MSTAPVTSLRLARAELVGMAGLQGTAFCQRYAQAADAWLAGLLERATGGDTSKIALIAVGGYGRGELCPGSDLDVALVHHPRLRHVKQIADAIWYPVWDEGVHLDHSVRTPKGVLATARDDLKVILGLLDARLIAGDTALAEQVIERAREEWQAEARTMVPLLSEALRQRHATHGDVAFLLEPDIKEDRGGLRDLHAVHSAAAAVTGVADPSGDPNLLRANQILLATRVELHRRSGKETNQLLLQEQDPVAEALGYTDADALMTDIATAGRSIAWAGDDCWRRVETWLAGPKRGPVADRPIERGIVMHEREITLEDGADPATDCSLAFRCAAVAAETGVPMSHACLDRLSEATPVPADPWPATLVQALVRLLGTGRAAIGEIEALDSHGLMVRHLPEWQGVRNLPQRNAFHRFTVDRHLCETAAAACEFVRDVSRPDLLLLGALLHDIGKGLPGDHTAAGMEVVGRIARRMGFDDSDSATLVGLVEYHLLLPDTAAKRDLDDPATIDAVAAKVGDQELLLLLSALTQADSVATGPAASSPWKMRMVRDLVARTAKRLSGLPHEEIGETATPDPELVRLAGMVAEEGQPALSHSPLPDGDGWELRVAARDRPGLLASIAGTLALHGLSVRGAQAHEPEPGIATEQFAVAPMFDREPRWDLLETDVRDALDGSLDLDARLAAKTSDYAGVKRPGAALAADPRVIFDNGASERATVVEVRAPDGIGVLYRITSALLACDLDIVTAKVHTLGHEVVDTFYVRRIVGGTATKIADRHELDRIEKTILTRLDRPT